ncbi:MAG: TPM domain-containing protein [Pseudomonadota bacterium]
MANRLGPRLRRLLRNWRSTRASGRRAFPPATLSAIGAAIAAGEQTHRSELRLIVEAATPFDAIWRGDSNRQRAMALFSEYNIWDTEDNCGVLVYLNLAERKVDIVADRNVARHIDSATWQAICQEMTNGYARGTFHDSTLAALGRINDLLHQHFPSNGARPNELPDQPVML